MLEILVYLVGFVCLTAFLFFLAQYSTKEAPFEPIPPFHSNKVEESNLKKHDKINKKVKQTKKTKLKSAVNTSAAYTHQNKVAVEASTVVRGQKQKELLDEAQFVNQQKSPMTKSQEVSTSKKVEEKKKESSTKNIKNVTSKTIEGAKNASSKDASGNLSLVNKSDTVEKNMVQLSAAHKPFDKRNIAGVALQKGKVSDKSSSSTKVSKTGKENVMPPPKQTPNTAQSNNLAKTKSNLTQSKTMTEPKSVPTKSKSAVQPTAPSAKQNANPVFNKGQKQAKNELLAIQSQTSEKKSKTSATITYVSEVDAKATQHKSEATNRKTNAASETISKTDSNIKTNATPKNSLPVKPDKKSVKKQNAIMEVKEIPVMKHEVKKNQETKPKIKFAGKLDISKLLPLVQSTAMNSTEVQMVIDVLLSRHQKLASGGDWVEKGRINPILQMKKQLQDAETKLKEQMDSHSALSAKIVDLRSDLNSEKSKTSVYKKQLESAAATLTQKLEATNSSHRDELNGKLKEVQSRLEHEYKSKLLKLKQDSKEELEKQHKQLQTLLAEKEQQINKATFTTTEFEQQQQKLQAALQEAQQQLQNAVQGRDEVLSQYQQIQQVVSSLQEKLHSQESVCQKQVSDLQTAEHNNKQTVVQLQQFVAEREQLLNQLNSLDSTREMLRKTQDQLQDSLRQQSELDCRFKQSHVELTTAKDVVNKQIVQIQQLISEKDSLKTELQTRNSSASENGHLNKETNSNNLNEDKLLAMTKEVTKLKEELSLQKKKNEDCGRGWKEECMQLKSCLQRLFPTVAVSQALSSNEFVKEFESAADQSQRQQTEEFNKKVLIEREEFKKHVVELKAEREELIVKVHALEEAQKQHEKQQKQQHTETQTQDSSKSCSSQTEKDSKNKDKDCNAAAMGALQEENKVLQSRVVEYKAVLHNTESLLQSLQASVEGEEGVWRQKIAEMQSQIALKEAQVVQLNADKANMCSRMQELQATLDTVQQAEQMESQLNALKQRLAAEEEQKLVLTEEVKQLRQQLGDSQVAQVNNSNGPSNGEVFHEDDDRASISSASVSEASQLSATGSHKKKKKKGDCGAHS